MAGPVTPCFFLLGKMKTACEETQKKVQQSNTNAQTGQQNSIYDILTGQHSPLDWRHVAVRAAEIVVGTALVVVAFKALVSSSPTIKVISDTAAKGAKKL